MSALCGYLQPLRQATLHNKTFTVLQLRRDFAKSCISPHQATSQDGKKGLECTCYSKLSSQLHFSYREFGILNWSCKIPNAIWL